MPIYVFTCSSCGRQVEEIRKMDDKAPPDPVPCPNGLTCTFEPQITAPGLKFVGEGWGGWEPTADNQLIQRTTKGKRKSARFGKPTKKVVKETS